MGTNSSSSHSSQDILSSLPEQNIQLIASFLDLWSLENLQLTNRRMRYLFVSSLWNKLFIITFNPVQNAHISLIVAENSEEERQGEENSVEISHREIYTHEMFRRHWFERYLMRERILNERRRQRALEIERRKNKVQRYFDLFNKSEIWEGRILIGIYFFLTIFNSLFEDCYACSEDRCSASLSEKLQNCNNNYHCRHIEDKPSPFSFSENLVILLLWLINGLYRFIMSLNPGEAFVRERKTIIGTILKLLIYIGAAILYLPLTYIQLSDSECNGFSIETDDGLCTITATFGVTQFLITAIIFLLGALFQFFYIYWQTYAMYLFHKPIHPLNRPLLLDEP